MNIDLTHPEILTIEQLQKVKGKIISTVFVRISKIAFLVGWFEYDL